MKILHIKNLYVKLPNNFNGDLTDAIEEWFKYRKSPNKKSLIVEDDFLYINSKEKSWDRFLCRVKKGYRVHGQIGLQEWIENTQEWKDIPYDK